jgi:hypothetical protein
MDSYFTLQKSDLLECRHLAYTICEPIHTIRKVTSKSCLLNLFLGKTEKVHNNCKVKIMSTFEPVFVREPREHQSCLYGRISQN